MRSPRQVTANKHKLPRDRTTKTNITDHKISILVATRPWAQDSSWSPSAYNFAKRISIIGSRLPLLQLHWFTFFLFASILLRKFCFLFLAVLFSASSLSTILRISLHFLLSFWGIARSESYLLVISNRSATKITQRERSTKRQWEWDWLLKNEQWKWRAFSWDGVCVRKDVCFSVEMYSLENDFPRLSRDYKQFPRHCPVSIFLRIITITFTHDRYHQFTHTDYSAILLIFALF